MILEEYLKSTLEDLRNKTFTYLSILEYAKENDIDVNILEKEVTQYIKKETNAKRISMYKPIYVKDLKQIKNNYLVLKRINTLLKVLYGKEQSITKEMLLKIGSKEYNYLEEKLATLCYKYAKITDIDVLESNLSLMLELTIPNVVKYLMMGFNANDIMSYNSFVSTQIDKKELNEVPLSKHSKYLYELDKLTDETQIKEYLKNLKDNGIRLDKIKEHIYIYVMKKYVNEDNEFKDNKEKELKRKVALLKEDRRLKQKQEEDITKAENLITNFIDEGITLKEYLIKNNMTDNSFRKQLDIVKKYNNTLYEKYKDRTRSNTYMHFANEIKEAKIIINEINSNPNFDLLDFYIITYKEPIEYYKLMKRIMDEKELLPLKIFANENYFGKEWNGLRIKTYYRTSIIIEGEILTEEEKDDIINYLKDNNIPITSKTVTLSMKRNNKKVLKKVKRIPSN